MEKVSIYIDGGNFYHLALKKMGLNELAFDYEGFAAFLANGREICDMGKRIYVGTIPEVVGDMRSKVAMSQQTTLFTRLKDQHWEIKTSRLKTRDEELVIDGRVTDYQRIQRLGINKIQYRRMREKGIDVKLATDLIVAGIDKKCTTAILVSSDADLIPAVDWVRNRGLLKVEYVGFSIPDKKHPDDPKKKSSPLTSLIKRTDIQRVLVEQDLNAFIQPTLL